MTEMINKLEQLLKDGTEYISKFSEAELTFKPTPEKWSKKEILGHLIDSGINNLQRFTEIQFENKPYKMRKYNQDELVKANQYQKANTEEILEFWISINNRIFNIINQLTEKKLNYTIELENNTISDLRFLINDYIDHMEHHLHQIIK